MRHTLQELLAIVYQFYRHTESYDDLGPDTDELVAARCQAGSEVPYERWRALLRRLNARFPGNIFTNRSLHLPAGHYDACYTARLFLPPRPGYDRRHLGFLVSFLVPYYVIYVAHMIHLDPYDPANEGHSVREEFAFTFAAAEEPYVRESIKEIEATYSGYEPMPPEVGNVIVPDVFVGNQLLGEVTLYGCLFTEDW